jgi:ATP-dependent Clp protease protease subunit
MQDIVICIDSYGGDVTYLYGMLDLMEKYNGKKIITFTLTKAASCGALLLAAGTLGHRYASKNATLMVHETNLTLNMNNTKCSALASDYFKANNDKFCEITSNLCGKPSNFIRNELNKRSNGDWFMLSQEAKEIGLIDHIGIPNVFGNDNTIKMA